ncbi:acetyltransferase [Polaribacter sp.]|uniref:acetyltransferase n=1 Tax=Polaribacter sp. TaxID=1920175 RepID=UPI0025DC912F|nr:acetyltransferase [Polaribacter sp.]
MRLILVPSAYYHNYQNLPERLSEKYRELNFQNHCYLRIALDNFFQSKWDTKIQRPAYRNLSKVELNKVIQLLKSYYDNKKMLLDHNKNSLYFRGKL